MITFGVFILSATIRSHFSHMHMQRNNNVELYLYDLIILHLINRVHEGKSQSDKRDSCSDVKGRNL